MGETIFKLGADGSVSSLQSASYGGEIALQGLLSDHPEVMTLADHRWLFIRREVPVAPSLGTSGVWALDHLFIDEEAVPTLVETKLAANPQSRREVVGQMLDYAANGSSYWPIQTIRQWFEEAAASGGGSPDEVLESFLNDSTEPHEFWERVRINLEAGRIRLLFIADQVPIELQRIVEFLNEHMADTEVLALEIRRYADAKDGDSMLVPRVFGQTARAQTAKPAGRQWTEEMLVEALRARGGESAVRVAQHFLEWGRRNQDVEWWGQGTRDGSYYPGFRMGGRDCWPLTLWSYGAIAVNFRTLARRPPFESEALRRELRDRLGAIPGVSLPDAALTRQPSVYLALLVPADAEQVFFRTLDWLVAEIRGKNTPAGSNPSG